ncbi:NTP transferase domain-containing protein [Phaeobacter sp. HF9A]|uniref:NTP transferase domain-containing protein n=1 Tax=Phaeobacter sp. HF9A TaxID=2721561 RepID=UPI0014307A16|nr:NTP transferase domain-containing protein [Phaeobacter sp. HF9A]NIZ11912.1 NTP transferase domain-containing protein [Phaeobacter sp. HF9A]
MTMPTEIAAIVLAAGKGTRMGSDLHKVLHSLNGKPLLGHVLDTLEGIEAARRLVVVGAGREQITAAYPALDTVVQEEQLGTGHAVRIAAKALEGFQGTVLVLYGDVPLVSARTMAALCDTIDAQTAVAVLGFHPQDAGAYGRLVTGPDGTLERIVEFSDASDAERAITFCNSGILAVRADALFQLLPRIRNDNAKGEYYLTDLVGLARQAGHRVATAEADPFEVTGVNSQAELAALEQALQARNAPKGAS